jgi:DNA-binding MltR family transcriptional regulator
MAKRKPVPPFSVDQFHRFDAERGNPRGMAIVAATYMDGILERMLRGALVQSAPLDELFESTSGPLSSFKAKIDMCFALGLIPKDQFDDLHLARKIRNHFAHNLETASFEEPPVSQWCSQFSFMRHVSGFGGVKDMTVELRYFVPAAMIMTKLERDRTIRPLPEAPERDILEMASSTAVPWPPNHHS